jgi:hypothetical protein
VPMGDIATFAISGKGLTYSHPSPSNHRPRRPWNEASPPQVLATGSGRCRSPGHGPGLADPKIKARFGDLVVAVFPGSPVNFGCRRSVPRSIRWATVSSRPSRTAHCWLSLTPRTLSPAGWCTDKPLRCLYWRRTSQPTRSAQMRRCRASAASAVLAGRISTPVCCRSLRDAYRNEMGITNRLILTENSSLGR